MELMLHGNLNAKIEFNQLIKKYIYVLIFYCILFPADKINIKELLLAYTIGCYYIKEKKICVWGLGYGVAFPAFLILYSLVRGNEIGSAVSYGYVWMFLLILPAIWKYNIDIKPPFVAATYLVALSIDFIFLLDAFGIISMFSNPVALFFYHMNEIPSLGKGALSTFGYSLFHKACPLILTTYGYFIYQKKYLLCIPLVLSLLGCGTRANFLMAIFISIVVPVLSSEKLIYKIIVVLAIVTISAFLAPTVINKMVALNALKYSRSEAVKASDVRVVFTVLKNNVVNLLFGTGVGSAFNSPRGEILTTFEISYVDFVRQAGIFGMAVLIKLIVSPLRKLWKEKKWLVIGLISYLAVSFTNPLLVNSTSFILYILVYSEI